MKFRINADLFRAVSVAVSTEETRYYLNGVNVEQHPVKGVILTATDGHRLLCAHDENGETDGAYIVPAGKDLIRATKIGGPERRRTGGAYRNVRAMDFLDLPPAPVYDRVVMNPPFDRDRDIDHVVHAMKFLKPDGRLVAIMSAGVEYRETRKAIAFREMAARMNGSFEDLPAGAFSSVGTNVNTVMLTINADGRTANRYR